ncbi:interleukin-4 receptor subunit alpha [Pseudonaja textilis]|uniref:interleukin-4 receptor subunit alpha n=1 Tax=Pseudonaja textilis TaxID=8673 RepID=UPI000EA8D539|nr:interleukin-4 receptor subunit alpha [Pseudonaja textilis]
MGSWRSAAATAAGLLCLLWHLASSKNVQPRCHTDFATELVCHWEVDAVTNCSAEFNVLYQSALAKKPQECPLQKKQGPGTAPRCVCVIPEDKFKGLKYNISLARTENGAKVWSNRTWDMDLIVKPRPLVHLRIEKSKKDRTFILTWKRDYAVSNSLYTPAAKYEVAYWPQNHTEKKIIVPEDSSHHTIFADKLQSDSTYEARVRYGLKLWGETWSEWSATTQWLNDFEPSSEKKSWMHIVWLCVIVIGLILFGYLCCLWVKRKWWDGIPSPRKSKLAEDITAGKWLWVFGKMDPAPCRRPFPSKGAAGLPPQPPCVTREPFLVPEEVFLSQGSLTAGSSAGEVKAGSPEEAEEETEPVEMRMEHEDAVAGLFRDLVGGVLSTGDPGGLATSTHSGFTPEEPICLQGLPQPAYQGCRVEAEGCGLELPSSGPGLYAPEGQADWLPGLESSPTDPSCTALPAARLALGYKSLSSLEAQPASGFCPAWSQWPGLAQEGQSQQAWGASGAGLLPLPDTSGGFPIGQDAFSLYGAAAPETWLFPPQPGGALGASALQASGGPESLPGPKATFFSGYRAFSCALQSSLASPEFSVEPV